MKDLKGEAKEANAKALVSDLELLMPLFDKWEHWPEEARHWRISFRKGNDEISPGGTRPYWYPQGYYTMETTAAEWVKKYGAKK